MRFIEYFEANKKFLYWSIFPILAIAKIILISDNEVLARYFPHDDLWHITAASRAYWFAKTYDQMILIQYPIYSLFIFITHLSGIPLRITIEITYILSAFLLSLSLMKAGLHKVLGLFYFILMVFHPVSLYLFDYTLAETLYTPLLLLSLAAFIQTWLRRNGNDSLPYSVASGILFALLWMTRKENILIAIFLLFVAFVILVTSFRNRGFQKKSLLVLRNLVVIPSLIILFFVMGICTLNYHAFGIFAPSSLDASGYKSAYKALQSINAGESTRYVPVSTAAREIAYSVSPSFRELKPFLEDRNNFAFIWSNKAQGIDNDMAAGWFYWVLRDAVYNAGYKTPRQENDFYGKIATEIYSAINSGQVRSRPVLLDFVDPYFYKYLPYLPKSFSKINALFFSTNEPPTSFDDDWLSAENMELVDRMANRRTAVVKFKQEQDATISGWAFAANDSLRTVAIADSAGIVISSTEAFSTREDVQGHFKDTISGVPSETGFSVSFPGDQPPSKKGVLIVETVNNSYKIPLNSFKKRGGLYTAENSGQTLYITIEKRNFPQMGDIETSIVNMKHRLWKHYGKIIFFLFVTTLIATILVIVKFRKLLVDDFTPIVAFVAFIILTRMLLFAVLDSSSWDGAQFRYLFPVMPLYATFPFLIIQQCLQKRISQPA